MLSRNRVWKESYVTWLSYINNLKNYISLSVFRTHEPSNNGITHHSAIGQYFSIKQKR